MTLAPDRSHLAKEIGNRRLLVCLLDDGINARYAARPQGTFAYTQRLPEPRLEWGSCGANCGSRFYLLFSCGANCGVEGASLFCGVFFCGANCEVDTRR